MKHHLVLDVGTTGVKAFLFNEKLEQIGKAYETYPVRSKKRGWVEQDPKQILLASTHVLRRVTHESKLPTTAIINVGITNQRETTVLWDSETGNPIYPAIVWQDERTKATCRSLSKKNHIVREMTGLHIDPYFSATKIAWILKHVPRAKTLLAKERLYFGTIDTWLMFHLCAHHPHLTDITNAARTLLFDIRTKRWSDELCALFGVPMNILPNVQPSISSFGTLRESVVGRPIPVSAVCGDQQSSFYACASSTSSRPKTKITYGTGVFVSQELGTEFSLADGYFTTLVPRGKTSAYALEAKVCVSGPDVEKRLDDPKALRTYLYQLAKKTDVYIKKLPKKPKEIIIDGGSSRDGLILPIQEDVSGISTTPLESYDGTALGIAMMLVER